MSSALTSLVPQRSLTLWEREQEINEILDAFEEELSPEEEQELQLALTEAIQYAEDKREAFGLMIMKLDQHEASARRDIERLRLRITQIDNMRSRMKSYAVAAIRSLGTDSKGRFRKLMGRTLTLFIRALPASVEIKDEAKIPNEYKRVSVQMPAVLYERLCTLAPAIAELPLTDLHIDKTAIKHALEANRDVPGADLRLPGHDHTLIVR